MTTSLAGAAAVPGRPESSSGRSLAALLEEQLIIPSYASRWAPLSIGLHRLLSLPLQLVGPQHRWSVNAGGEPVQLVGVGREKLMRPLFNGLFGHLPAPVYEGRRVPCAPGKLTKLRGDLIAAEVHRWMAATFRRNGWLIVPRSVRWQGNIDMVPPVPPSRSLHANLVKLRKQNFTLVQGGTAEDWNEFYTTMVLPQAQARHGSVAWIASRSFLRSVAATGTLHFIVENGVRIAGGCTIAYGDTLWFTLMGVRYGDPSLLKQGAGVATLALPIEWARQNHYRRLDLGRTGSFINDGLQQYKRNWGFVPVPDPLSLVTAVWIGSPQARQAFARHPVLIEAGDGLEVYSGESL